MIKVLLTGGLGNQMFQYAFGRNLSVKNNTNLVLSSSYLQSKLPFKKWATAMKYELDIFNVNATVESNIFSGKLLYPIAKAEYLIREKINNILLNEVQENVFSFQRDLLNSKDNSFIKGNFQSEKYFKSIEDIIRKEFTFKTVLSGQNAEWKNDIENSNSVSIHVRRGDYISIKSNAQKFAQIPISYFQQAIQYIASKTESPVFFVFSDDTDWVKENLKVDFPLTFITNNYLPETSHQDMQLMSLCKHNIICNSTFSWWSAWLNTNPQKTVIAPQQWFSDVSINSQDIIPDEWIKL
jgi:hypothetical protein